jgi:hypothetical protein
MDRAYEPFDASKLKPLLQQVEGLVCWRAYTSMGNSPGLFFGNTVNLFPTHSVRRRAEWKHIPVTRSTAEIIFIIWCTWRLDATEVTITSSDDRADTAEEEVQKLSGRRLISALAAPPAGDLTLTFSGDRCLKVFCDHVPGQPSYHGNWQLKVPESRVLVGPGSYCTYENK